MYKKQDPQHKGPYTVYYPHTRPVSERQWNQSYYQFVSVDCAKSANYAVRVERRYHDGRIVTLFFDKRKIGEVRQEGEVSVHYTYQHITAMLDEARQHFGDTHYFVVERQLPQNYKATRVAQHTVSYFLLLMKDAPLLPAILEVDPKLKGKMLGAPKGITEAYLKSWAVEKARELFHRRQDYTALAVMDQNRTKQDDLADTACQIEALCALWNLPLTPATPPTLLVEPASLTLVVDSRLG